MTAAAERVELCVLSCDILFAVKMMVEMKWREGERVVGIGMERGYFS